MFSSSQRAHSNEPLVTVIHFEKPRTDYPNLGVDLPTWSCPHHTYLSLPSSTRSKNIAGNSSNTSQVPQTPRCGRKVNPQLCFQLLVECLQQKNERIKYLSNSLRSVELSCYELSCAESEYCHILSFTFCEHVSPDYLVGPHFGCAITASRLKGHFVHCRPHSQSGLSMQTQAKKRRRLGVQTGLEIPENSHVIIQSMHLGHFRQCAFRKKT